MDRLEIAVRILTALIVEDRIAWHKDPECFGHPDLELVSRAFDLADAVMKEESRRRRQDPN